MSNDEKIKCYELDFGDTNLITKNIQEILDWIKADIEGLEGSDELSYVINIKMMTQKKLDALPEWS